MLDALTFDAGSTLTPDYMLMLDSRDITGNISDRLMSMTLTDNRGFEADQLDIELNDADGQVGLPVRGAVLTVYIGWKGFALVCKGKFTVDEVEHRGAPDAHQRPEAAKAEGKTETQKERETPARAGAPESETSHAEESAKSTGSARR